MSASEAKASQGNETMIETLSSYDNVSSLRDREAALVDPAQNENEMQIWTQIVTDNTNNKMSKLRIELNEKLEKLIREAKTVEEPSLILTGKITDKQRRE